MDLRDVKLTISAEDTFRMVREIELLKAEKRELHKDIDASHKAQDCLRAEFAAYKAAEAEREANIRRQIEREYRRRAELLELNERKVKAYQDYHNAYGIALNAIKNILCDRITKKDDAKLKPHLDRITKAWEKFYAVQKQVAKESGVASWEWDPCKTNMPPPSVKDEICAECAAKMGKVPVDYPVGHWTGYCDFCGQAKPLSSLSRDYVDKEGAKE